MTYVRTQPSIELGIGKLYAEVAVQRGRPCSAAGYTKIIHKKYRRKHRNERSGVKPGNRRALLKWNGFVG
jgi:hypothetical protein